jgi:hypothetical protein
MVVSISEDGISETQASHEVRQDCDKYAKATHKLYVSSSGSKSTA